MKSFILTQEISPQLPLSTVVWAVMIILILHILIFFFQLLKLKIQ